MAQAFHEPKRLEELGKADLRDQAQAVAKNPELWDQDHWWSGQQ